MKARVLVAVVTSVSQRAHAFVFLVSFVDTMIKPDPFFLSQGRLLNFTSCGMFYRPHNESESALVFDSIRDAKAQCFECLDVCVGIGTSEVTVSNLNGTPITKKQYQLFATREDVVVSEDQGSCALYLFLILVINQCRASALRPLLSPAMQMTGMHTKYRALMLGAWRTLSKRI